MSASVAHAQANAILLGSVRSDSADIPLRHAEVAIPSLRIAGYTDSVGHFRVDNITPGEYDVVIRHLGFTPRVMRMKFDADETTAQQFELSFTPTVLAKVKVTARDTARSLNTDNLARFDQRRARGFGAFITTDELRVTRGRDMTTVLHTLPAIRFYRLSTGVVVAGSAESGGRCYAQVYLDGVKIAFPFDINSLGPESMAGIEYYASPNSPSDYIASPGYCGVLVFWTRVRAN